MIAGEGKTTARFFAEYPTYLLIFLDHKANHRTVNWTDSLVAA